MMPELNLSAANYSPSAAPSIFENVSNITELPLLTPEEVAVVAAAATVATASGGVDARNGQSYEENNALIEARLTPGKIMPR